MKIVITGASGFIGREVMAALSRHDVDIIALSRQEHRQEKGKRIIWKSTDYSVDSLKEVLMDAGAVIHLAAVRGTEGKLTDYSVNLELTENLLIAAGERSIKRVVVASSIAVSSDISKMPWTEDMMLTPKTLYGITKAAGEHLCQYYARKYGFTYAITRIAQVLGTGEKRRVMTNVFMEQAFRKEQLHVIGKSIAKRQYIYSRDLAEIISRLALDENGSVIVNVGMDEACTNLEIAEKVNRAFGSAVQIDYDDSKPETIEPSIMSVRHFHEMSDYEMMTMDEALDDIASDYQENN